jgi:hypothetical protein
MLAMCEHYYEKKEKTMEKKKFWLGMLAVALVFGMTVVGCGDDDDTYEEEHYNKFHGWWGEATDVNLVGITNSDEIAGIVHNFPYSFITLSTVTVDTHINAVKIGSTWYSCDGNAWWSKDLRGTEQWYSFTNTHYQTSVGFPPDRGDSIPYTFNDTDISINGINYPYTITEKRRGGLGIRILHFNGKYFLEESLYGGY